jgi:hypothetical protein
MQLIPVYLYPNKITAYLNSSWTKERFRKVYNRNLKIYRSIDNKIDFQIKNGDQKPTNILGKFLVFNLFSQDSNRLLLQRDCEILSNNGRAEVKIDQKDLNDLDEGYYNYSLILEQRESQDNATYKVISSSPLYIDEQYGAISVLEISGDVFGTPRTTLEVKEFSYVNPRTQGETDSLYFISSIIDARPNTTDPQTLHTFQIYFTDFDGKITIQGSMSKGGAPERWIDIGDNAIFPGGNNFQTDGNSVIYKNILGKWNWFRIKQTGHSGNSASFIIEQTILGNYVVGLRNSGSNYSIGDILIIEGRRLGGSTPENNLVITINEIDTNGKIVDFSHSGSSIAGFKTFVLEPIEIVKGTIDKILYR